MRMPGRVRIPTVPLMTDMTDSTGRRVTANLALTLDGRYNGPGGPADFAAFVPYVTTDVARDHMTRMWETATTALLGRISAEGFMGFWSSVVGDENADPRDRAYAKWLVGVEKVVLSTTLNEAPWERTRVVNAPAADVVADLKTTGEGDIFVNSSASIIKALLSADLLDRLYLMILPVITGGGQRLFEDGLPASKWTLTHHETGELGEIAVVYDRTR
jgi:dihydrofolate reductase